MKNLYIVATPIGNLKDITLRALEVLKSVDVILAEDTRVTRKLLSHYGIRKPVLRLNENVQPDRLINFKNIALITDAGTPGVSDPGRKLVSRLSELSELSIVPIPGPSALTTMISVSDIELSKFLFLGFPPAKNGRKKFFDRMAKGDVPVILFESPHRISRTLSEIYESAGDRYLNIGRELTKLHEEIFRGRLSEAVRRFRGEKARGEFAIIIHSGKGLKKL